MEMEGKWGENGEDTEEKRGNSRAIVAQHRSMQAGNLNFQGVHWECAR